MELPGTLGVPGREGPGGVAGGGGGGLSPLLDCCKWRRDAISTAAFVTKGVNRVLVLLVVGPGAA